MQDPFIEQQLRVFRLTYSKTGYVKIRLLGVISTVVATISPGLITHRLFKNFMFVRLLLKTLHFTFPDLPLANLDNTLSQMMEF